MNIFIFSAIPDDPKDKRLQCYIYPTDIHVTRTKVLIKTFINSHYCSNCGEPYQFGKELWQCFYLNSDSPKFHQILTSIDDVDLTEVSIYVEDVREFDEELGFFLRTYPVEIIRNLLKRLQGYYKIGYSLR